MSVKHITLLLMVTTLLVSVTMTPAMAGSGNINIICETDTSTTGLGGIIATVVQLIVTLGALAAIVGGAGFTMAAAARPGSGGDYTENRNDAIKYGGGSVVALYLAEALVSQLDSSLSFGCVLPFA